MTFDVAAAVSEHPIPAHAVGACVGDLLEAGGPGPVAVVVAVTEALAGALEDVVAATRQLLGPEALVAVTVGGVVGGAREIDDVGAVMMFALWDRDGHAGPVRAVRLTSRSTPEGHRTDGLEALRGAVGTLLVFTDPFSVDDVALLEDLDVVAPALRVVGGGLTAARYAGGNRLVLDASTWTDGAVGLHFGDGDGDGDGNVAPLISRAARAISATMTVTAVADGSPTREMTVVTELAGRPARAQLDRVLAHLDAELVGLATSGVFLGSVQADGDGDPAGAQVEQLALLGGDVGTGGLAVGGVVPVGASVRFEVRDPAVVEAELVDQALASATDATGAFVVVGATRGMRFHGVADADASAAAEAMGSRALAGVVLGGEFAPVAGRNRRLTSSVVVVPFV